jgi:hypothetical protein
VVTVNIIIMNESGVDLGFDFAELSSEDLDLCSDLLNQEESLAVSSSQNDFMFYELKSKTVPERLVCCTSLLLQCLYFKNYNFEASLYLCFSIFVYKVYEDCRILTKTLTLSVRMSVTGCQFRGSFESLKFVNVCARIHQWTLSCCHVEIILLLLSLRFSQP